MDNNGLDDIQEQLTSLNSIGNKGLSKLLKYFVSDQVFNDASNTQFGMQ